MRGPALSGILALVSLGCLAQACTCKTASSPDASPPRLRRVDVHEHISTGAFPHALKLMDEWGIDEVVQLSGGWPGHGLEANLAEARARPGRFVVFANPPLSLAREGPPGIQEIVDALPGVKQQGAKGLKIFKSLGLSVVGPDGALLAVDDPLLDPVFEKAGELGLPIAIHTGDPVAFWQPVGPENERIDELSVHPRWSYAGKAVSSWEQLFEQYERRVARHPKTIFIGVHFGNAPEDPARVGAMLDKYPNLYVDTAARVPELGRRNLDAVRELFVKHADRILFGTDLGVGVGDSDLMLGSTGATPPGPADIARFFTSTWRFFETRDSPIPTPTPIQGRWDISGLGLPREVLEKIYAGNADRLLGLR